MEGIAGLTKLFREEMIELREGSTVVFAGSSAVCAPFAELLAYSIRDRKFDLYFSPMANETDCRSLVWREGTGYTIDPSGKSVKDVASIVVLGGLAMPKFGCDVNKVKEFIDHTTNQTGAKIVGVCFMDILRRSGWTTTIQFNALINSTMDTEKQI